MILDIFMNTSRKIRITHMLSLFNAENYREHFIGVYGFLCEAAQTDTPDAESGSKKN